MAAADYAATLSALREQQSIQPLSILSLAEPILSSTSQSQTNAEAHNQFRPSDASSTTHHSSELDTHLTPTSLAADLTHYKELFSKLRFSYLEQVTKEKYLRSIVGDPPLVVTHDDNLALEESLVGMKADVKRQKEEVEQLVTEMDSRAREVAARYRSVAEGVQVLETVPLEVQALKREVEDLKRLIREKKGGGGYDARESFGGDARMNLSLEETADALEEQRARNRDLDQQIELLQRQLPAKTRECEKVDAELGELEKKRNEATRLARDVRRRKEEGGRDELEQLGRWYRGSDVVLRGLLGSEG
ncbi:uncharacterized protein A1O9_05926 [Exophiala aquamarina CBS 119918]|uniref:Kinetochore protein Sos7 coiled-coil domain-containing protein n=1 Tax=Exophiala aquamarina CBS 119918 TaxID=1182545 RepID=A0A072PFE8_9EURO|nr:uncharacterized protein A1O9_05926 [Exophiala aquamarina CBS 119918]KEF58003.1 hypothetical protein A1O9_05926 [Exophiala aquamarina CBS 119918]